MTHRGTSGGLQLRTALAIAALVAALVGTVGAAAAPHGDVRTVFTPLQSWNTTGAEAPPQPGPRFPAMLP
ncbi:hypothetical protein [Kitasatospora mediocidica]|uniref:hypothetical protein n=1 Tax=Kitasatospora mediocidica TaxID=58352 RepID=UPI00055B4983|nr:hypothetical protein [Kitasatospora mediocidica]